MNIGIDVDGVLTNLENYQLEYGLKYFGKDRLKNPNGYGIEDIFDCTKEEREKFWIKYIWGYCLNSAATNGASEIIKKLKEEGNKIYIITGRAHTIEKGLTGKLFRKMLIYWFEKNNIEFDQIIYVDEKNSAEEKFDVCNQLGIDVMLEDKSDNIEKLKDITKIICFNTKENMKVEENENVIKVNDFYGAYKVYNKYKENYENNNFKVLNGLERESLSEEEQKEYYEDLRNYYMNLPYDVETMSKLEKNYVNSLKIGMPIFKKIFKPVIINKELIPEGNNLIFVSNHLGSLDQFPIMAAIEDNRPIHFMAAAKLLKMKRGLLYRKTGCIFVDRNDSSSKEEVTKIMNQILCNDGNIFMFPEGTRNFSEKFMLDFKKGAVSIAQTSGATIVPFAINNNYGFDKNPLIVRVGTPFKVSANDNIEEKTLELRDTIATMVWENMELEKKLLDESETKRK